MITRVHKSDVSRSGLDRCLRRHGVSNLQALRPKAPKPAHGPFAAYEPGVGHSDVMYLPPMADEPKRRYLFGAIDRATRWVFVQVKPAKTARAARAFLAALVRACPVRIRTILTDYGKAFTDRFVTTGERSPSGALCAALGIEHRLTRLRRPQTNGMVERFNGRIAEVLRSHHFMSGEVLKQTLLRYAWLVIHHLPHAALNPRTPGQARKVWQRTHPHLFHKRPYGRQGLDILGYKESTGWV